MKNILLLSLALFLFSAKGNAEEIICIPTHPILHTIVTFTVNPQNPDVLEGVLMVESDYGVISCPLNEMNKGGEVQCHGRYTTAPQEDFPATLKFGKNQQVALTIRYPAFL